MEVMVVLEAEGFQARWVLTAQLGEGACLERWGLQAAGAFLAKMACLEFLEGGGYQEKVLDTVV